MLATLLVFLGENLKDVESDSLGQRSALASNDGITFLNLEARRNVYGSVLMSLLESVVFSDHMEVISSDDDGSVHLGRDDNTLNDLSSDADITSEGALFIDVGAFNSFSGGLEAKADVSVVSKALGGLADEEFLGVEEDTVLLLEGSLDLSHFYWDA